MLGMSCPHTLYRSSNLPSHTFHPPSNLISRFPYAPVDPPPLLLYRYLHSFYCYYLAPQSLTLAPHPSFTVHPLVRVTRFLYHTLPLMILSHLFDAQSTMFLPSPLIIPSLPPKPPLIIP